MMTLASGKSINVSPTLDIQLQLQEALQIMWLRPRKEEAARVLSATTAPPPKQKQQAQHATGQMSSSIIDSFAAAPPSKQKQPATAAASSSIIDRFDTPTGVKPSKAASIFDSCDSVRPVKYAATKVTGDKVNDHRLCNSIPGPLNSDPTTVGPSADNSNYYDESHYSQLPPQFPRSQLDCCWRR